jgi:YebC/PmpR family DNA-binding regulatory protein
MWRRHSIAARKASWDAAKSKRYSILSKVIQIAAKKWADPKMNPSLDLALQKARYYWVPRDIVDRAILKGSWQLEGEDLQEILYEWYWPWGVAIIVKTLTSNSNRTSQNIRLIMNKYWWSLWQQGSVVWQFTEKWVIVSNWKKEIQHIKWNEVEKIIPLDPDGFENEILETAASDFLIEWWIGVIYSSKQDFAETKKQIEDLWYNIQEADIQHIANNEVSITHIEKDSLYNLISSLEDDEDVDQVYHNLKE